MYVFLAWNTVEVVRTKMRQTFSGNKEVFPVLNKIKSIWRFKFWISTSCDNGTEFECKPKMCWLSLDQKARGTEDLQREEIYNYFWFAKRECEC